MKLVIADSNYTGVSQKSVCTDSADDSIRLIFVSNEARRVL